MSTTENKTENRGWGRAMNFIDLRVVTRTGNGELDENTINSN